LINKENSDIVSADMPILFVVATPLGNLKDITVRVKEVLASVDIIACEDTRHSAILAKELGLKAPLVSYHQYSGEKNIRSFA